VAGFGREPFGHNPFGHSDFGSDTISRVFPKTTLEKDTNGQFHHYLLTIENSVNQRKADIDKMIDLVDADRVRLDILLHLGAMIGATLDDNEGEQFKRTLVRDAVQYYQVKGTDKSFSIRGKISGFDVEVIKIWKIDPMWLPDIPDINRLEYPPGSGVSGIWYTDLHPESVSGVSGTVPITGDCTYCLTSYIKIKYTLISSPSGPVIGNLLDRVIEKIKDVIPIHIRNVFIDLTVYICASVVDQVCLFANEDYTINMSAVDRYDIIPADCAITDLHIPAVMNGGCI
jgi:hypothetical protein